MNIETLPNQEITPEVTVEQAETIERFRSERAATLENHAEEKLSGWQKAELGLSLVPVADIIVHAARVGAEKTFDGKAMDSTEKIARTIISNLLTIGYISILKDLPRDRYAALGFATAITTATFGPKLYEKVRPDLEIFAAGMKGYMEGQWGRLKDAAEETAKILAGDPELISLNLNGQESE